MLTEQHWAQVKSAALADAAVLAALSGSSGADAVIEKITGVAPSADDMQAFKTMLLPELPVAPLAGAPMASAPWMENSYARQDCVVEHANEDGSAPTG